MAGDEKKYIVLLFRIENLRFVPVKVVMEAIQSQQGGDIGSFKTHLFPKTHQIYSYIWDNSL